MTVPALLQRLVRVCCVSVLCVALVAVLGAGHCSWCSGCDDDDDCFDDDDTNDDDCDDDDDEEATAGGMWAPDGDAIARQLARLDVDALPWGEHGRAPGRDGAPPPPWLLDPPGYDDPLLAASVDEAAYRLDVVSVEGRDDPLRHPVARVRASGPTLLTLWGRAAWSGDDFTAFAARILAANDELLGLPPWAGRLRPAGASFLDTVIAVVFEQLPPGAHEQAEPLEGARLIVVFDHLGRVLQVENETVAPPGSGTPTREAWDLR